MGSKYFKIWAEKTKHFFGALLLIFKLLTLLTLKFNTDIETVRGAILVLCVLSSILLRATLAEEEDDLPSSSSHLSAGQLLYNMWDCSSVHRKYEANNIALKRRTISLLQWIVLVVFYILTMHFSLLIFSIYYFWIHLILQIVIPGYYHE